MRASALTIAFAVGGAGLFGATPPAPSATELSAIEGFQVERIHAVAQSAEGSWVCLTVDGAGRLLAGDQHGGIYRITVPPPERPGTVSVERLELRLPPVSDPVAVGAHGLAVMGERLFVMSNERAAERGLWQIDYPRSDGGMSAPNLMLPLVGRGEHGPHALVPSADGRTLYFAAGNQTKLPAQVGLARPRFRAEDQVVPRLPGERGSDLTGGYVGRYDPERPGLAEIHAVGFRNHYDLAVDETGELFTYDSDPEPSLGAPWYEPTRILHVVSGADFGWRSGTGRWPSYAPDSLPPTLEIGPGSPTGLTFGTGARFPARYQRALFAADWSFGILYAIHLKPDGASFTAEHEAFLTGKPLPITDLVISPHDGALYFIVGGRRTQSALYRVSYRGPEDTTATGMRPMTTAARARRQLERWHTDAAPASAVDEIWEALGSSDRFLRHAARVALEHQPLMRWRSRVAAERDPRRAVELRLELVRAVSGEGERRDALASELLAFVPSANDPELMLGWIRAWQIALARGATFPAETHAQLRAIVEPWFPATDARVTRELAALLVALDSRVVVERTVPLLAAVVPARRPANALSELAARNERYGAALRLYAAAPPDTDQVALVYAVRQAKHGWTAESRRAFAAWFGRALRWRGGHAFLSALRSLRTEMLAAVEDQTERAELAALAESGSGETDNAPRISPRGPGRAYSVDEAIAAIRSAPGPRDRQRGQGLFRAAACTACHLFEGEGTGVGPDLSGASGRYSLRDLLENTLEPSRVISDQYAQERIERRDGTEVTGRVVAEEDESLLVLPNVFAPGDLVRVRLSDIRRRSVSPVSLMPPGLLDGFNSGELADLAAFLLGSRATQSEPR